MSPWTQSYAKAANRVSAEIGASSDGGAMPMSAPEMAAAAKISNDGVADGADGGGNTADSHGEHEWQRRHKLLDASLDQIWENLKYCAFLLDAEVTAPALLSLASSILLERGPLPVGEIGKCLQEATANPTLSNTLKDKFGGLKKFLEKYPDRFLMGSDNVALTDKAASFAVFEQYRPLWDTLTPETSEKVRQGNFKRLFDAAAKRVRAWEKENPASG